MEPGTPAYQATKCAHTASTLAPRFPGVPCEECHGWIDHDGTIMDRATTIARYPHMAEQISADPAPADGLGHRLGFGETVSQLGGALTRIVYAAIAFVVVVFIIIALWQS